LPLASDMYLDAIAHTTKGFTKVDLQDLFLDAQPQAIHDLIDSSEGDQHGKKPIITDSLLKFVASKARPLVSDVKKRRLRRNSFHSSNSIIYPHNKNCASPIRISTTDSDSGLSCIYWS
ncbi:hypothetical protein ACJRO7_020690, partial [Eucalyptus globulus]